MHHNRQQASVTIVAGALDSRANLKTHICCNFWRTVLSPMRCSDAIAGSCHPPHILPFLRFLCMHWRHLRAGKIAVPPAGRLCKCCCRRHRVRLMTGSQKAGVMLSATVRTNAATCACSRRSFSHRLTVNVLLIPAMKHRVGCDCTLLCWKHCCIH